MQPGLKGLRSFVIGTHNPLIHGFFVAVAWRKIYRQTPTLKEFICILLHDIGYVKQLHFIAGSNDRHPEMGAKICGQVFGEKYYQLCIAHSRDYANKLGLPLSRLGYADKYSVLVIPNFIYQFLVYSGGEAAEYHRTTKTRKWGYPMDTKLIKKDYQKWWDNNWKQEVK